MYINVKGNLETLKWRRVCSMDKTKLYDVLSTCNTSHIKANFADDGVTCYAVFMYCTSAQYRAILKYYAFPVPTDAEREFHALMRERGLA